MIVPALLALALNLQATQDPSVATYDIDFTAATLAPVVRAQLPVTDGRLFMAGWGADLNKRGWAHYVRSLRAVEMDGRPVTLAEVADSAVWRLADSRPRTVRMEYQVDMSYAKSQWPYGNEQAATLQNEDLYSVSKALFIVSSAAGAKTVRFHVPTGWYVTTPWPPGPSGNHSYSVRDTESLIDNSFVVGPTAPAIARAGRFTFFLAALGAARSDRTRVGSALENIVSEFVRVFPETPASRYLMTLFRAPERDAEAYSESAAFTEPGPLAESDKILWASTLAHELFHAWNGHAIRSSSSTGMQWFSEGFTDYYASRTLARARIVDESLIIRKLEHTIGLYLFFKAAPVFDSVTLVSAGERKGRNRLGVYNGGWVAAFCMDTDLRAKSNGKKNLDDVMRLLHTRFGLTGPPFSLDDLKSAIVEVSGSRFDDFFSKYVVGHETMPVAECLKRAGYEGGGAGYDGDYYVTRRAPSSYRRWVFGL